MKKKKPKENRKFSGMSEQTCFNSGVCVVAGSTPGEILLLFIASNKFKLIFLRTPSDCPTTSDTLVLTRVLWRARLVVTRSLVSEGNRCQDDSRADRCCCVVRGMCQQTEALRDSGAKRNRLHSFRAPLGVSTLISSFGQSVVYFRLRQVPNSCLCLWSL